MGRVVHQDRVAERLRKQAGKGHVYFAHLHGTLVVDATDRGSYTRFAGHACEANTDMVPVSADGWRRIMLVTNRQVRAGEEVTVDYNFDAGDWRQACQCGAQVCRGWLHRVPARRGRGAASTGAVVEADTEDEGEEAGNVRADDDDVVIVVDDGPA